jgi:hypothetical protein
MAQFPKSEMAAVKLGNDMVSGFGENPGVYPAPPVPPAELLGLLETCMAAHNACVAAQAVAEQKTVDKNETFGNLVDAMKSDLRYAENTVDYDDEKLKLIGWAGRKQSTPLAVPGQCRLLEATRQGEGWVFLDWKAPLDGGKPAAYLVMRRERSGGNWQDAATAMDTEATLADQPRGKELEFQVVAVNKTGQGEPSNTVMCVL